MRGPGLSKTLLTSATIFVIVFWMIMVTNAIGGALFKTTLWDYFDLKNQKTLDAMSIVEDRRFFRWFLLYSTAIATAVPFIYKWIKNTTAAVLIVILCWSPCVWYGVKIRYVGGKMVDWSRLFREQLPRAEQKRPAK